MALFAPLILSRHHHQLTPSRTSRLGKAYVQPASDLARAEKPSTGISAISSVRVSSQSAASAAQGTSDHTLTRATW